MCWHSRASISSGSDHPLDPLLPFVQIETAINYTGEAVPGVFPGALSPGQTIPDLLAAIKIHTINSSYQLHQEGAIGSIEVGKQADLIVLSQNLFDVPIERISETKVMLTMLGGKVVYEGTPTRSQRPSRRGPRSPLPQPSRCRRSSRGS